MRRCEDPPQRGNGGARPHNFFIKDRGVSEKQVRGFAKQGHLMKQTHSQEQSYSPARGSAERGK